MIYNAQTFEQVAQTIEQMKSGIKSRVTLNDVAAKAGVSTTTASLVLAGKATKLRIAGETLEKVRAAADELNYVPNLLFRSLRKGRTHIFSFYTAFRHRERNDYYMNQLSSAVEEAAGRYGFDVLVHCNFQRSAEETFRFLTGGFADGLLLFAPLPDDPLLPMLRFAGIPTVLINSFDPEKVLHSVRDDVEQGMSLIADELVAAGHTNIAMLVEIGPDYRDSQRRSSLLQGMLIERGVPATSIRSVSVTGGMESALAELMASNQRPTAIFAWHDALGYKVLDELERMGCSVPRDVSVVGYDGFHWPSSTHHRLASVVVDLAKLTDDSVSLLSDAIEGRLDRAVDLSFNVSFDRGTTIGPPPHR